MAALEKFGRSLARAFEKDFLFDGAHPGTRAHFVGHGREVFGIHAAALVPSATGRDEFGRARSVALDDLDKAGAFRFAFDGFCGIAPFFRTTLEGVEKASRAAGVSASAELIDGRRNEVWRGEPVVLCREGERAAENEEESKDHRSRN